MITREARDRNELDVGTILVRLPEVQPPPLILLFPVDSIFDIIQLFCTASPSSSAQNFTLEFDIFWQNTLQYMREASGKTLRASARHESFDRYAIVERV